MHPCLYCLGVSGHDLSTHFYQCLDEKINIENTDESSDQYQIQIL
jgi:hypothetical protein